MNLWIGLLLGMTLSGCARVGAPPHPPVVPPFPPPQFEKTFGSIQLLSNAGLRLQYKKIALLIDPAKVVAETDYVFATGAGRWNPALQPDLRRNIKILCSAQQSAALSAIGFSHVKSLGAGQRLLLRKEDAHLFASATAGQSYFLEFDNGKNIFVGGVLSAADPLREFVYALRDDGREIEIGFFRVGSSTDRVQLAQIIGLLQPKNAVLVMDVAMKPIDLGAFREQLKTEFFEGPVVLAGQEPIVF